MDGVLSTEPSPLNSDLQSDPFASTSLPPPLGDNEDADFDEEQLNFDSGGLFTRSKRYPKGLDPKGHPYVVVVDINGIHHLPTRVCMCEPAIPLFAQYLQLGLYPVSQDRPQTVFTFRLLDDYHLTNLETKAAAQSYYAKLRRLTDDTFPHLVPDRYRELLRAIREWRNLRARQTMGVGYGEGEVRKGGLVPFCPTCPQPGVNLPDDWKNDHDQ